MNPTPTPTEVSFSPVGGYWLVILLGLTLAALLLLGPTGRSVPRSRRITLALVRFIAILLVVFGMLRPTLEHTETTRQSATFVVLADRSRSMRVADVAGKKTRWEVMATALEDAYPALKDLRDDVGFDVQLFTYDGEAHQVDLTKPKLDLGEPDGQETAIGAVLEDILRRESGKRLAGVVLLGDGAQRAPPSRDISPQVPARVLAKRGYPLYTVPLGQARGLGQARDVAIEEFSVPEQIFVKNQLTATGLVRSEGFVNQKLLVQLLFESSPHEMKPVAAVQVQPNLDLERLPIELSYVPDTPGEYKVTLRAATLPGEIVTTNNEMSTFVTVLRGGLNVLYLEGVARVEQKFLRRSLDASPDIRLDYLRINAPKNQSERSDAPADLAQRFQPGRYDVYIIGDLDSTAFTTEQLTALAEAVNRGAGLIMLGGLHSFGPGGYGNTPLANVLPIGIDRLERQNFDEPVRSDLQIAGRVQMRPTAIGETQTLMQLAARPQNAAIWANLPPLDGANRFHELKPGAQVLAESDQRVPLLVAKDYGRGRVLAFAGDSTWRWWMQGFDTIHRRFWRQAILWLARKDQSSEASVWITLDKRRYAPGERIEFTLGAKASTGEPIADATWKVEVIMPDGRIGQARLHRDGDQTAGLFLDAQMAGDYVIRAEATAQGQPLGKAEARSLVYEQDFELENPAADRGSMESLAAMTGGRSLAPEELPRLLEQIKAAASQFEASKQVKRTLWDNWFYFLLFIGVLVLEWYLRKRWGLV